MVRPCGRVPVQQTSRSATAPDGGACIEAYIAPERTCGRWARPSACWKGPAWKYVRWSRREHYARIINAWHLRLEEPWDDFVRLAGNKTARVWRLYLIGAALAFEERRMGANQFLAVRPKATEDSGVTSASRGESSACDDDGWQVAALTVMRC
ncbi:class I SAM-dependent methyltransferase [Streptomyces sp. NPDC046859]|uniref:class I SAM-dependent methyltransferase n=1 Tax=Streptomyces sp. NPDC046859 TaxID=3155734 RepID=UPI0033FB1DC5